MTIHVIHDPRRHDRWELFTREAAVQGFTYRIWPAVRHEKPCTGISRAHKNIVRWARREGLPEVLVMEDDVRFCDEGALHWWIDRMPADFDMYLAGTYWGEVKPDGSIADFSGLHCYVIRQQFYDTFLKADEDQHLDRWLASRGQYYCSIPFAAIQHNGLSDNVGKVVNYDACLRGRSFFKKHLVGMK